MKRAMAAVAAMALLLPGCGWMSWQTKGEQGPELLDETIGFLGTVAEWSGIPGAAVAVGAIRAARRARQQAQDAAEAQGGPSRAQAQVSAHEERLSGIEASVKILAEKAGLGPTNA